MEENSNLETVNEEKKKPNKVFRFIYRFLCYNFIFWSILVAIFNFKDMIHLFYPKIDAVIEKADCKYLYTTDSDDYSDSDIYKCIYDISYTVNNKEYIQKDVELEELVDEGENIYSKVKVGNKITIWYKKDNPNNYGIRKDALFNFVMTLMMLLFSSFFIMFLRMDRDKKEKY